MFYEKLNFILQMLFNIFNIKSFRLCCYCKFVVSNVYSHYHNYFIKLLQSFLVILFCWYKIYSIFLISFLVCTNCFQSLFVLILLKTCSIVGFVWRFLILSLLLLLFYYFLLVAWLFITFFIPNIIIIVFKKRKYRIKFVAKPFCFSKWKMIVFMKIHL